MEEKEKMIKITFDDGELEISNAEEIMKSDLIKNMISDESVTEIILSLKKEDFVITKQFIDFSMENLDKNNLNFLLTKLETYTDKNILYDMSGLNKKKQLFDKYSENKDKIKEFYQKLKPKFESKLKSKFKSK
jgi:hypothetical protein